MRDIDQALELNHLNYLAYFNLFSVQTRREEDMTALQSLCCGLSCLHLLKARLARSVLHADKAIRYAQNNQEAHTLKGLMLMQQSKYIEAYYSF